MELFSIIWILFVAFMIIPNGSSARVVLHFLVSAIVIVAVSLFVPKIMLPISVPLLIVISILLKPKKAVTK